MTTLYPWSRLPQFVFTALDETGTPIPGATLTFYASGTSTPLTVYSDADHAVPYLVDPEADQAGRFPPIFLQSAEYKIVYKDADGNEIGTYDPVSPFLDDDEAVVSYYDMAVFFNSKPAAGETYPIYNVPRDLQLPADLTGSIFTVDAGSLPTATATFTLQKNGNSIGTIAFDTFGAATVTFTMDTLFAAGDQFSILAPGSQDATMNFIAFTFVWTVL